MAIVMPTVVDDNGTGTTGTILDLAKWTALGAAIDTAIAAAGTVGTWVPADGSGAGLAFTVVTANYIKLGRLVHVDAQIVYPATANGANAKISGLPFTPTSRFVLSNALATLDFRLSSTASTTIDVTNNVGVPKTNAQMTGANFYFSGTYLATS